MLDIIGLRQLQPADKVMKKQEWQHDPAERPKQRRRDDERDRIGLQQIILPDPKSQSLLPKPFPFHRPAAHSSARQFAHGEPVDAFAHPRRGRVFGRCHHNMMTPVMFDAEMTISRQRVDDFGAPLVRPVLLVSKLVPNRQPRPACSAGTERQRQESPEWQGKRADCPGGGKETGVENRDRGKQQPAVIFIRCQRLNSLLRRIVRVLADEQVQQRYQTEIDSNRQQRPQDIARPRHQ